MKKYFGIVFGGLQKKTLALVLLMLILVAGAFLGISAYQSRMLVSVVEETRVEQQQAISQVSEETMHQMLEDSLVSGTVLQANLADSEISEIVNDIYMLQSMAEGLLENRDILEPILPSPPDPALDGIPSAMVLTEEGVDYTASELLGAIAHMSGSMVAMQRNSDKIDGCYVGLADGTDLCVDDKAGNKYDENGVLIPFPVRERPWYTGAVEADGIHFTGIIRDAFSGRSMVTCSAPIHLRGKIVGVAGIDIVLESMDDFVTEDPEKGTYTYVINGRGEVILGPESFGENLDLHSLNIPELDRLTERAVTETTGLEEISFRGKTYYMVGSPMPTAGWAVINVVDKELTEQPERLMLAEYDRINDSASARFRSETATIRNTTGLILFTVFLIGLLAALVAAQRIVQPIERMTRSIVHSSRTGELFKMEDAYRTNDEIELLAEAFDDLSKKTKSYIGQITAITAEKERINTELSLATKIQADVMPHIFPAFPERSEFDIYATMDPAKEVGGDFYDYYLIDDDHLCLVMADVSGKGVPAALFMMASKIVLQSFAMQGGSPGEILTRTNKAICSNNQEEMFITVWLGILEISTGRLIASNAGHEYPILKKSGGSFEVVKDKHGFVIGGMDGVRYREYELDLQPGDKLFLYTDGVPEATAADGTMFGMERMVEALNAESGADPEKILKNVALSVEKYVDTAEQFDDLTMLCLEYRGGEEKYGS